MSAAQDLPTEAEALKSAGNEAYRQQVFPLASEKFEKAISFAPDSAILYSNLAASLLADGRLTEAINASNKAIELDPAWFKPHVRLSGIYEKLGKITPAIKAAEAAVNLATDPAAKATNQTALAGLRRRYLVLSDQAAVAKIDDLGKKELSKHSALRAQQLVKQGKATFAPFSEGARVYAAFARIAELNKIMAMLPFQVDLISEFVRGIMLSPRGFHQVARRVTNDPLEVTSAQLKMEQRMTNAISSQLSPAMVIQGYEDRKRKDNWTWERVNTALDLSISAAAFSAQISMYLARTPGDSVDQWTRAWDIIKAGQAKWSKVAENNQNRWMAPHMTGAIQCGLLDAMIRYFNVNMTPEVMSTYPKAVKLAGEIIESISSETVSPEIYLSSTDYAAFKTEHLVIAHRDRGFVYGRYAIMIMHGAVVTGPIPLPKGVVQSTWWNPSYGREAACDYITAAAFSADDDPERANYLFIAINNMCHSGHVSIRDIKALYDIALKSMEAARPLFGDDAEANHQADEKRVRKLYKKLDTLVKSGKATLGSRLHPFPDPDGSMDTLVDEIVPTVFAEGENEMGWRTPDGKFEEVNPIFSKVRAGGGSLAERGGWKKVTSPKKTSAKVGERTNDHDDWEHKSYHEFYEKARRRYQALEKEALDVFAQAVTGGEA